jgi:branched-chain amino acid transport system permease protein
MPALLMLLHVLFDGVAYGMLLFLISAGLSVTMGMMGFVNLAHGALAMLGGYVAATLVSAAGMPFLLTLPAAFLAAAAAGLVLERLLFRHLYGAGELDQVLLTIGVVFISVAGATFLWGPAQVSMRMPGALTGSLALGPVEVSAYRLFLVAAGLATAGAVVLGMERTRFGARIRACVDNRRAAEGLGIDVGRVFLAAFSLGSGLAGLGGALAVNLVGLDPGFALRYLVYFLTVVALGGPGSVLGTLAAALVLGIGDVAGKYYLPEAGAFLVYGLAVALLLLRPSGLAAWR